MRRLLLAQHPDLAELPLRPAPRSRAPHSRARSRAALDDDESTWQRAPGWAIIFASLAVGGDSTFPTFAADAFEQVLLG